ncbi:helix-turn-helix domain-containing protein [Pseudoduganella eburnea]|uniref:Helix-turn-helix domain-containing protein n=1 Tax=Massilia eburnea TaxID=1776165 RepID=A0A6L6QRY8_9BURK|nr:AraC family transcriptional regulator [Massilia eburnea]MTW14233.1 helix-turn-helix domain-containing protein [Massilia eburnea]
MNPSTTLLLPPPELQGCVRAFISRDTTGSALSMAERLNRFPSTPLCTLTWFLSGKAITVEPEEGVLLGRIVASGPLTRPVVTFNPGPVRAFMAVFYPSAWHQMCGLDPGDIVDCFIEPSRLGPGWMEMAQAVLQAPDDGARVALLAAFFKPRWTPAATQPAASWLERLKEAAHAGAGASARSIERRFKAIGGQPLRTLRRLDRAERTLADVHVAAAHGELAWSDIAAEAGYSDQAHLCREVRAITGATPAMLARGDESFWLYRIWR